MFSHMHGLHHFVPPFFSSASSIPSITLSFPSSFSLTPYFLWLVATFSHWLFLLSPSIFSKLLYIVYIPHILLTPASFVLIIPTFPLLLWLIWFLMTWLLNPNYPTLTHNCHCLKYFNNFFTSQYLFCDLFYIFRFQIMWSFFLRNIFWWHSLIPHL